MFSAENWAQDNTFHSHEAEGSDGNIGATGKVQVQGEPSHQAQVQEPGRAVEILPHKQVLTIIVLTESNQTISIYHQTEQIQSSKHVKNNCDCKVSQSKLKKTVLGIANWDVAFTIL